MTTTALLADLPDDDAQIERDIAPLVVGFTGRDRDARIDVVRRAYLLAGHAHREQRRKSGEPYLVHPLAVAQIVAELGLDDTTIAAALLHDAVEDSPLTTDEVAAEFGPAVARIVDGVTKLDRVKFDSKQQQQAATFRKMLVAMAQDLRVLIIKLCDRLHNLRTIAALPAWKQERTAVETIEVYAPLAHRLGMQEIKSQLEDLSFAALHPKRYATIEHMVAVRAPERDLYLAQVMDEMRLRLDELGIVGEVTGREKHLWSIYDKMQRKTTEFEEIHDLIGVRIIVESVRDCYAAMGSVHSTWKPVQGRFKDYVAMPKFNLYQSLHTTVVGPQGKPIEFQIRTVEMHSRAEFGVAAHFIYKDGYRTEGQIDLPWLDRIIDWEKDTSDHDEFMANLKVDLDEEEVFVFTPTGDVVTLPAGATPIDFAYAIHTDVGHRCVGAKVNGKLVSLSDELHSGETVEIFTSKGEGSGPSVDWLKIVRSPKAASKIRHYLTRERREDAIANGSEELQRALRREGLPVQKVASSPAVVEVGQSLNYHDLESLHAAIGEGHVSARSVAQRVRNSLTELTPERDEALPSTSRRFRRSGKDSGVGVHVEGLDDLMIRLSRCCTPVPGDEIIGFVTRGRGVSVHRADCANAVSLVVSQKDRLIEVDWDSATKDQTFLASAEIRAYDRSHLLSDVSAVFSEQRVNIVSASTATDPDRVARLRFEFEVSDPSHLDAVLRSVRSVDGVFDAYRVVPGRGG